MAEHRLIERGGWALAGFAACAGLASITLMEPSDMIRWVQANGTISERVERALEPSKHFDRIKLNLSDAQERYAEAQTLLVEKDRVISKLRKTGEVFQKKIRATGGEIEAARGLIDAKDLKNYVLKSQDH